MPEVCADGPYSGVPDPPGVLCGLLARGSAEADQLAKFGESLVAQWRRGCDQTLDEVGVVGVNLWGATANHGYSPARGRGAGGGGGLDGPGGGGGVGLPLPPLRGNSRLTEVLAALANCIATRRVEAHSWLITR